VFDRTIVSDYVRCRACDQKRIQAGGKEDLCQPHNTPEDLLCPCGGIREPYECQSEEWITEGRVNSDPMARVVPDFQASAARSFWRDVNPRDVVTIGEKPTGSSADVVAPDDYESEIVLRSPRGRFVYEKIVYTPSMPAPKAGSKGYQRRQNQRWPKGR